MPHVTPHDPDPPRLIADDALPPGAAFAAAAHAQFLAVIRRQGELHREFLETSTRLLQRAQGQAAEALPVYAMNPAPAGPALEVRAFTAAGPADPPHHYAQTMTPVIADPRRAGDSIPELERAPAPPTPSRPAPVARPPSAANPQTTPTPSLERRPAPLPRGPAYDRHQLEILASGRISAVFGPAFAGQDGFARQVRMPEPPLLLADRVTGIDAPPGIEGPGTIWTETDVGADAWYLSDGRMPAGIMIESGQADLLLASWMGVDADNRGERVYRLLGCQLTYHGELPRPGETLCYDIHIDRFARQGDVRLFFFHYDCRVNGELRLSVREGQAGFFSDAELAASAGVLYDPTKVIPAAGARLDPPPALCAGRRFDAALVAAFAEGRVRACFGATHARADTHTRTPRIQAGRMLLMGEVAELDPTGGPWGRGYLRAIRTIDADDWFFAGHFKNDPCMPGTLMFEGGLQAMAFYLAALGHTLERDGWRFEPVGELAYPLRCRGQVRPDTRELVCEIFVEELWDGPIPTLYADILGTVDGLKAFHCRRMGLRLVPGFPLESLDPASVPAADPARAPFDARSLLACAWGRPSEAFGPAFARFDGHRRLPRLPGPPYHFLTRVEEADAVLGVARIGSTIEAVYEIPPGAWYFDSAAAATMPFCVLLEAGLQPCGWLACFIGVPLDSDTDVCFRNLDGVATVHAEVRQGDRAVKTRVTLSKISRSAGMVIVGFEVSCRAIGPAGPREVMTMTTVFGFFPPAALARQVGLPPSEEERAGWPATGAAIVDFAADPERLRRGALTIADAGVRMIDRIVGAWPEAGAAGLGRVRAEKDVAAGDWYFRAHFFQDPVQPGSLGLEAILQGIRYAMLAADLDQGIDDPRFESIATELACEWKYRGQVVPEHRLVTVEIEVLERGRDARGPYMIARGWLWADAMRIYEAKRIGVRIVAGPGHAGPGHAGR